MSQGFGPLFDRAQQRYDNAHDDPSYQDLVAELAQECTCSPKSDRPCAGLLAGGLCDDLHTGHELDDQDEQETELRHAAYEYTKHQNSTHTNAVGNLK